MTCTLCLHADKMMRVTLLEKLKFTYLNGDNCLGYKCRCFSNLQMDRIPNID